MVLVSGDVGWTISEGKDLFRQRGCMGCHRYEGYDREPEELQSPSASRSSNCEQQKTGQPQAGGLPDEAGGRGRKATKRPTG